MEAKVPGEEQLFPCTVFWDLSEKNGTSQEPARTILNRTGAAKDNKQRMLC